MEKLRLNTLRLRRHFCGTILFCALAAIASHAQTFTTLLSFDGANGRTPMGALFEANDGHFYGTTSEGGANDSGVFFKMTRAGKLTTLYSFCSETHCADVSYPMGLVKARMETSTA